MNDACHPKSSPSSPYQRIASTAGRLTGLFVDAVFPTTCPSCGVPVRWTPDAFWCEACGCQILTATGLEYCGICGRSTGPYERRDGRCGACRGRRPPNAGLVRVGPHKDPLRQMVLDFKFGQAPLDRTLGGLMAAALAGAPWRDGLDALVPVPMHWRRRLQRRHHPTRTLAKVVASRLDLPVVDVLRRTRHCPPQVGLSELQRRKNVKGTFGVVRGARLEGVTVCLIDDVTTTGATLLEASRTLRKAGAAGVYSAVVTKSESIMNP